jgi:hypothetical protein
MESEYSEEETAPRISKLKVAVFLLALALIGCLVYITTLITKTNEVQKEVVVVKKDKEKILGDFNALKIIYDNAIAENTAMSQELIIERDKIVQLMEDIKKSDGSIAALTVFKNKFINLDSKMKNMVVEVNDLLSKNKNLSTKIDSTNTVLNSEKLITKSLSEKNEALAKTVEKASVLTVLNFKCTSLKVKNSGKESITDQASKVNRLRISFFIAENKIVDDLEKKYYIQVIDPGNNVLGEKKTIRFNDVSLTYSFEKNVSYNKKTVEITEDLPGTNFAKGTYYLKVFDKNEVVSNTSFDLK